MSPSVFFCLLFVASSAFGYEYGKAYKKPTVESGLTKELLREGFLNMVGGVPTVKCVVREKGQAPRVEECKPFDKRSTSTVGCFSAWHEDGGHLQQGCLNVPEWSSQCKKTMCAADPTAAKPFGMQFCCCFGDKCNTHYSVAPLEEITLMD